MPYWLFFFNNNVLHREFKIMINFKIILKKFSLAKLLSASLTIIIVASVKYTLSGEFHVEYSEFFQNVALGLLGWTTNTYFICLLSEFLDLKGINFNLKQLIFGLETLNDGGPSLSKTKPKLYFSMESDEGTGPKNSSLDKGKGIDRESHSEDVQSLDKGKDKVVEPFTEPPFST